MPNMSVWPRVQTKDVDTFSYSCAKAAAAVLSGTVSPFPCALLPTSVSLLGCELPETPTFLIIPVQSKLQWHYNPLCFDNIDD